MIRTYVLPALAVLGLILGVRTVLTGAKEPPPGQPVAEPARAPYQSYVAGAGIVESNTENIAIATQVGGLVTFVNVVVGSKVAAGDLLFQLDDRAAKADVDVRRAAVQVAKADLDQAMRREKLVLASKTAISVDEQIQRRAAVESADAKLAQSDSQLKASQIALDILSVRAPINGTVLQVKVRVGEYAPAQALSNPLMVMGNIEPLYVRVDVDENDAWRVKAGAKARANVRGNPEIASDLKFVRFEPYVIPKRSLTGDSTERVDTRVLQVIYEAQAKDISMYVGQLLDVFIEAPAA